MLFKVKSKSPVTLETIAFADIVINLFIFFFITFGLFASFDAVQKGTLSIELPKASTASHGELSKPVTITIDHNGKVYLDSRRIPLTKLRESINYELSSRKEKSVLVRADRSIALQKFITVLDLVRNTKAKAVAIEAEI